MIARLIGKILAAQLPVVWVLHPTIAESLVRKVVSVLRIASPAISRVSNVGWLALSVYTAPNLSPRKRQSPASSFNQRVDDLVNTIRVAPPGRTNN